MGTRPLRERFGVEMARTARLWRSRLDERLAPLGLTQAKWVTLHYLAMAGEGVSQRELAERIGVEGPTLVRVLDGLERLDLIKRWDNPEDRRSKTVHLTATAGPVLAEIARVTATFREEILDGVSDEELALCERVLERMARNVGGRIR